jgi:hypothetical protein
MFFQSVVADKSLLICNHLDLRLEQIPHSSPGLPRNARYLISGDRDEPAKVPWKNVYQNSEVMGDTILS